MEKPLAELFDAARQAQTRAYAPYSRFRVGAAIRGADGRIFAGCNVENAAYPVGSCAEAGAISAMVAAGETRIAAILVLGDGEGLVTPCGACRQRIREFGTDNTPVHVADAGKIRETFLLGTLLPASFGPSNLGQA